MSWRPYDGLTVTILSRPGAERWTRHAYRIPPHVGVGFTPYTVLVQSYGCTAYTAFHGVRELKRWLGSRFRVDGLQRSPWRKGSREYPTWAHAGGTIREVKP